MKPSQIGIRCSGTRKCSQRYEINHFCQGIVSVIQPSEMPPKIPPEILLEISPEIHLELFLEIPPEVHLEMHLEISPNNDIYGRSIGVCATDRKEHKDTPRRANKQQDETAIPSSTQNPLCRCTCICIRICVRACVCVCTCMCTVSYTHLTLPTILRV